MNMQTFWQSVTRTPLVKPTTIHWDLSAIGNWAMFNESCRLVQDTAYLTMDLVVPYLNELNGERSYFEVTISNAESDRELEPPSIKFGPPLRITNSCLAEGTRVATSAGASRKIEELRIGDQVVSPFASGLTITDT